MLKILLERRWKKDTYTIGRLYVGGKYFCETLEDKDRGLKQTDSLEYILQNKVPGETAIPTGRYEIDLDTISWKYYGVKWYKNLTNGYMPRLKNVPGYEAILIHPGNTALDSLGCILVGKNTEVSKVTQSRDYFSKLYKVLKEAHDKGEKVILEIR